MSRTSLRGSSRSVHPHGRGDNWFRAILAFRYGGSPPRAWGQSVVQVALQRRNRFTPTGVGTMTHPFSEPLSHPVHPHGRGDNALRYGQNQHEDGSPPRAWGQLLRRHLNPHRIRFTPTGVGTMTAGWRAAGGRSVHPHGRGDNCGSRRALGRVAGSPPRAWGQSLGRCSALVHARFTPTGVGTIALDFPLVTHFTVHPHGRGDNKIGCVARLNRTGSPPRAWGQWLAVPSKSSCWRFTPTGVGTIATYDDGGAYGTVHPHGRGDNTCVSGILMRFASKNKPRSHVPHQDGILTRKSPSTCMS